MKRSSFIDTTSSVPIFQQIVNEIERQILTGDLKEGDFLPSVREFAVAQTINPNTVAKAYQQLQVLELVESIRGKGLIAKKMKSKAMSDRRENIMNAHVQSLAEVAQSLGVPLEEVIKQIQNVWRKK